MALHTQLPIYRTGLQLLQLAHRVQEQMPRGHPVEGLGLTKALRRVRSAATTKTIAASACGVSA